MTLFRCFVLFTLLCSFFLSTAFAMEEDSPVKTAAKILRGLPHELGNKVLQHLSTEDLLSMQQNSSGAICAAARYELINRGGLVTFSMQKIREQDLPALVTFLQNRAHAPHLTISSLNSPLLLQAFENLRVLWTLENVCRVLQGERRISGEFSFKMLRALTIMKTVGGYESRDIMTRLLDFSPALMPCLTSSNLNCNIGDAGAVAIAGSPNMRCLTSLNLRANGIGDAGAAAIANSPNMAGLTSLDLAGNNIWPLGAAAIANSPHIGFLTFLNLNNNYIRDAGAIAIANSPRMAGLTFLSLGCNEIGDAGAIAIANSPSMVGLTSLDFHYNSIRDAGAIAIANSHYMARLTFLNFSQTQIEDMGVVAVANSQNMGQLTSLNFQYNPIGDAGATAVANSPNMAGLTFLKLGNNNFGEKVFQSLVHSRFLTRQVRQSFLHSAQHHFPTSALIFPLRSSADLM